MQFLRSLVNYGMEFTTIPSAKRGLQLSNTVAIVLFGMSLLLSGVYYIWYGWTMLTYMIAVIGLTALIVPILNKYGYINISRIWISVGPAILITFLSVYSKVLNYDQQQELDYFTFRMVMIGSCVIPWVVFSLKEKNLLIASSLGGLTILLAHDPLHTAFGVPYQEDKLKVYNYYFTNIIVFITYSIITASIGFLKWISERNEDENIGLIGDLAEANKVLLERNSEIEAQSAEIQAQSDILHNSQNQLIEANKLVDEQRKQLFSKNQSLESELIDKNVNLTETNTELIKHNNELRQFSYTVSHNLRGPVASLLGLISLIDKDRVDERDREVFEHLATSTHQLDQIIKDISKIVDIRHDIFRIRQRIDLNAEIQEIAQVLRRELEAHQVTLNRNLHGSPYIYSIKPMVNSILYNLISNGVKYRSAERQPVIEITSRESDDFYYISVQDNGLGIDLKQNRESLFKLYKRFHFHTEGKGLGLFLVKLQCESLGGAVDIESELNRFTRFTVCLKKPVNIDRQILYQEPFAEIFFDARVNATGVTWKSHVTSEQYRNVFRKCLEFVRSYNTPNYIADLTHQGPIESNDQRWMFEEILPPAIRNGLKRIAAIRTDFDDPLVKEYHEGLHANFLKLGAEQRNFSSREEAFEWIERENERAATVPAAR
ncbi:MAG TPA: HAMP domain-containing sensor histidine kinase [Chryseolinea sp.]|nr:HAMP domain-containing sensor histidine kinase [Chryseolinea sp.]